MCLEKRIMNKICRDDEWLFIFQFLCIKYMRTSTSSHLSGCSSPCATTAHSIDPEWNLIYQAYVCLSVWCLYYICWQVDLFAVKNSRLRITRCFIDKNRHDEHIKHITTSSLRPTHYDKHANLIFSFNMLWDGWDMWTSHNNFSGLSWLLHLWRSSWFLAPLAAASLCPQLPPLDLSLGSMRCS